MQALIAAARQNHLHALMGAIDATNAGSIALHQKLGFQHVGTLPQVGFKFGRWLDLAFYQLLLDTRDLAARVADFGFRPFQMANGANNSRKLVVMSPPAVEREISASTPTSTPWSCQL